MTGACVWRSGGAAFAAVTATSNAAAASKNFGSWRMSLSIEFVTTASDLYAFEWSVRRKLSSAGGKHSCPWRAKSGAIWPGAMFKLFVLVRVAHAFRKFLSGQACELAKHCCWSAPWPFKRCSAKEEPSLDIAQLFRCAVLCDDDGFRCLQASAIHPLALHEVK